MNVNILSQYKNIDRLSYSICTHKNHYIYIPKHTIHLTQNKIKHYETTFPVQFSICWKYIPLQNSMNTV